MVFIKTIKYFVCGLLLVALCSFGKRQTFNIDDFGAKGDSITLNTVAIQQAIDQCSRSGGGTVVISKGIYISGTILLKSDVTLHILKAAKLVGSSNPAHYQNIDPFIDATGQQRGKCLVGAVGANNIAITGGGTIDGVGEQFKPGPINNLLKDSYSADDIKKLVANRPFLVRLVKCTNIKIADVHLRQPAAWTLHLFQCKKASISKLNIYSHANQNNDGIDIDLSEDIVVNDCDIDTGDDAICFKTTSLMPCNNISVRHCRLKSEWGAIKIGTEFMGDFTNISVKKCLVYDTRGGGIKILSVDGANIR